MGLGSMTQELFGARLQIHDPRPHTHTVCVHDTELSQCTALVQSIQRLVKKATHQVGPRLPLESPEKRDQKLYLQPTCTYPGRHNLREQDGNETRSGETAGDCQGDT